LSLGNLIQGSGKFIASDIDCDALSLTKNRLTSLEDRLIISEGNVLSFFRKNKKLKYKLILAGGLFDYLDNREVEFVIKRGFSGLIGGGEIIFTNFSEFNPYINWIEYLANWNLIYRSREDIYNIIENAIGDECEIEIILDKTGVTYLTKIKKYHDA